MKGERWEQFEQLVMKTVGDRENIPAGEFVYFTLANFKREHAAVVRAVKKLTRYDVNKDYHENQMYLGTFKDGAFVRLSDVLAALTTRKGKT